MYDEYVENSSNFAPRSDSAGCIQVSEEAESTITHGNHNEQECSPSKVFQRHRSLAELSSVAVSEKQALDKQENSQGSDTSEVSSTEGLDLPEHKYNTSAICLQLDPAGKAKSAPLTPTKVTQAEGINVDDPLTPTANLKMLMSVVSPAIRDREEKKKDLFFSDGADCQSVAEEVVIEKPNVVYSRKDKSLGLLCQRFLDKFPENPGDNPIEICLDEVSKELKVERRRVYDIVNVLESVEVLSRVAKNRYLWHGKTRIAHTLGRLKVLTAAKTSTTSKKKPKENPLHTAKNSKSKLKRHFSCGDLPKRKNSGISGDNQMLKERNLSKEEERSRIKAVIDSTDHCRKDKSLGVLSQKFLIMFLLSKGGVVTLEDAANVLLDESDEGNVKYKTKVRRLYDIANILSSLLLIEKVHIRGPTGKKPGFKWIGVDIESLPANAMPTGPVLTFKTKHSLLPEMTEFVDAKRLPQNPKQPLILPAPSATLCAKGNARSTMSNVRFPKSASCSASFVRHSSLTDDSLPLGERSNRAAPEGPDGFLVHEFAPSPVNVTGRDMALYSPTEASFLEEVQKLGEKFPDRMSQLLAVLPFNNPSGPGSGGKTSRRNLFSPRQPRSTSDKITEPDAKRIRTNPPGDFKAAKDCNDVPEDTDETNNENEDPEKTDSTAKFMHSTNSPFKVMATCGYKATNHCLFNAPLANSVQANNFTHNEGKVLEERQKQQQPQWRHVGQMRANESGSASRIVQLVDQAVSPIPPSKLVPRSSIAVQASLIKDISPLKPLVFLHRIPSPWKQPGASPSAVPPAPPSTPELPNEITVGPFQSQANKLYLRNVSPYPISGSQSCGTSPVAPFSGAKLFFPPSPTTPSGSVNNLVLPQGSLLCNVNQIMSSSAVACTSSPQTNPHSNSCPPSVNPSPTPLGSSLANGSGIMIPELLRSNCTVSSAQLAVPFSTPFQTSQQIFTYPATMTPSSQVSTLTPCQEQSPHAGYPGVKHPSMVTRTVGLGETPSFNMDQTLKDNVSRKLRMTNDNL